MTKAVLSAALALLGGVGSATAGADPLTAYEATYRVEYKGMHAGDASFSLHYDRGRGRYVFESQTQARGIAKMLRRRPAIERSEFEYRDGRIVPLVYTFEDGSRKGKRDTEVVFDWSRGLATSSYRGVTVDVEVEPGTLDRMTMQAAVMRDVARPTGPSQYPLVDRNVVKEYRYEEAGTENLDTIFGSVVTKVYLQRRTGSSRQLKVWIAPSLKHMAVRMEQQRDGETQTVFTLQELSFPEDS